MPTRRPNASSHTIILNTVKAFNSGANGAVATQGTDVDTNATRRYTYTSRSPDDLMSFYTVRRPNASFYTVGSPNASVVRCPNAAFVTQGTLTLAGGYTTRSPIASFYTVRRPNASFYTVRSPNASMVIRGPNAGTNDAFVTQSTGVDANGNSNTSLRLYH
ncbi:hypothetical protein Bbelb_029410 [Branchiostoma belcheri]|nr:hypothetical protein Bbelb_029410 [Branchiostoma belcheri]